MWSLSNPPTHPLNLPLQHTAYTGGVSGFLCGQLLRSCPPGTREAASGTHTDSSSHDAEELPETIPGAEVTSEGDLGAAGSDSGRDAGTDRDGPMASDEL